MPQKSIAITGRSERTSEQIETFEQSTSGDEHV